MGLKKGPQKTAMVGKDLSKNRKLNRTKGSIKSPRKRDHLRVGKTHKKKGKNLLPDEWEKGVLEQAQGGSNGKEKKNWELKGKSSFGPLCN